MRMISKHQHLLTFQTITMKPAVHIVRSVIEKIVQMNTHIDHPEGHIDFPISQEDAIKHATKVPTIQIEIPTAAFDRLIKECGYQYQPSNQPKEVSLAIGDVIAHVRPSRLETIFVKEFNRELIKYAEYLKEQLLQSRINSAR